MMTATTRAAATFNNNQSTSTMTPPGYDRAGRDLQALDDGGVGHAAAFAHRLEAVPAAGALELVEQRRHQAGARCAERVTERNGAAVRVHLRHVRVVFLLPRQHDRRERLV